MIILKILFFILLAIVAGAIIYFLSYLQMRAWLEAFEKHLIDKLNKNKENERQKKE